MRFEDLLVGPENLRMLLKIFRVAIQHKTALAGSQTPYSLQHSEVQHVTGDSFYAFTSFPENLFAVSDKHGEGFTRTLSHWKNHIWVTKIQQCWLTLVGR